ncbi:MAG: carboxypeptidase-like regulatory domain-containing protein, partial [Bacteroidales bacterium]|nr:carboxypeptidase-like regulatory domain-containing protein [Bacteroidales bacterium]
MNKLQTFLLFFLVLSGFGLMAQNRTITGTVIDDKKEPLPFANVYVLGSTSGTTTDMDGKFSLTIPADTKVIEAYFIGFKKKQITLTESTKYDIVLESEAVALEAVVVVGNMERKKESFTGSFTSVSGNELKQMGSQNVVQSLRSLDASFVVMENLAAGADPNAMPAVEVRGQTSIAFTDVEDIFAYDPNQPLFVLDGFETTLQKIIDLDPNRVASITILKDAASTAFYGSRAANGVVLVETVKGVPGRFKVTYSGNFSTEIPNLSSYNMMNAEEKLRFELLSGYYTVKSNAYNLPVIQHQDRLDSLYFHRLSEVQSGVSSYWMSEPLQIPFQQRQTVRVSGGEKNLVLSAGLTYRTQPGLMK